MAQKNKRKCTEDSTTSTKKVKTLAPDVKRSEFAHTPTEEQNFPRGGAPVLNPLEFKEVVNEASRDFLFDTNGAAVAPSMVPRKRKVRDREKTKRGPKDANVAINSDLRIEGLNYKILLPGALVLGCVEQVNATDIALSLPNSLTGYVPLSNISDHLTKRIHDMVDNSDEEVDDEDKTSTLDLCRIFRVGQYLRAYVVHSFEENKHKATTGSKSKKRIELSLLPQLVNADLTSTDLTIGMTIQGAVNSVEDHGLVMDVGLGEDAKGFLSSNELGPISLDTIQDGQVILTTVIGVSSNGKIVKLSGDLEQKFSKDGKLPDEKASWWLSEAPTIEALLPGTGVEILVTDIDARKGVTGKVMGMLDVVSEYFHIAGWQNDDLARTVKAGKKIKGRILYTTPQSIGKRVGFSILPHVLSFTTILSNPFETLPIATIIDKAVVIGADSRKGVVLDTGVDRVPGFVHISRLSSEGKVEQSDISSSSGTYSVGTSHTARVLGISLMDGLFQLTMEKQVIEQPFLRVDDIMVGSILKGKIAQVLDSGSVLVSLADRIEGIVEELHLSDVKLKHPEKKFRPGAEVKARVLATNPCRKKVWLSMKKTLVNSDLPIITSYRDAIPGTRTVGTLVSVLHNGAVVKFYSGVAAFLPVSEMSEAYIRDPREHFRVGQSVTVHIVSVDSDERKMRVSCRDPETFGDAQNAALAKLEPGFRVSGVVSEKFDSELMVELNSDSTGAVSLKGLLVNGQLTDGSREKSNHVFKQLRAGQVLKDLVVLNKIADKRLLILSQKPSLVKAATAKSGFVRSIQDVQEGTTIKGWIKNVTNVGVFIGFPGGITGLALKRDLPEESLRLPDYGYKVYTSIDANVKAVDHEQGRFLLTLRSLNCLEPDMLQADMVQGGNPRATLNPVDENCGTVDSYTPGTLTKACVVSIQDTQVNVKLADNVQGRIDVSQYFPSWEDIKTKQRPLSCIEKGAIVKVKVIGIHDAKTHVFLPITHRKSNTKMPVFELSAKIDQDFATIDTVKVGSTWIAFVNNIMKDFVWVNIAAGLRGRIRTLDLSDDVEKLRDVQQFFPIGCALKCVAVNIDLENGKLDLSARKNSTHKLSIESLVRGMILPGRITKTTHSQIYVHLSDSVSGLIHLTDIEDNYDKATTEGFQKGDIVRVCVLDLDKENKRVSLSTRPSKVLDSLLPVRDPEIQTIGGVKVGQLWRGFVKNVSHKGLFVTLGGNVTAWVKVSDLSDSFLDEWKNKFAIDQLVEGRIVAIDTLLNHVQMSLRQSAVSGKGDKHLGLSAMAEGMFVSGRVKKVTAYGVFIVIEGSSISGLCHRSQIADEKIVDISKLYAEGDLVKAKVLSVDLEKRRINFGLKASYFAEDDSDDEEEGGVAIDLADTRSNAGILPTKFIDLDEGSDNDATISSCSDEAISNTAISNEGLNTNAFDFTGASIFEKRKRMPSDFNSSDTEIAKTKRRKGKSTNIKLDRTSDLLSTDACNVSDFERLLLGDPNSSQLWIRYMAFQLQLDETEKARHIAKRALSTISHREENERLHIWIAMMNLEERYGDDESTEATFREACISNDPIAVHEKMANIYMSGGKTDKADSIFRALLKIGNNNPTAYVIYAEFLFKSDSALAARDLLKRALQALPQPLHKDVITRFASLEFKYGEKERGRTLFENLIATFKKNLDVFNIFIDMEIKHGTESGAEDAKNRVRALFERVIKGDKIGLRQAQAVFKKWLGFEEKLGGEKVGEVAKRAKDFVEKRKIGDKGM